jgi:hypothetical protein
MSGYDEIRCRMPLPAPGLSTETVFQTRAFVGVFGEHYTISSDGRLIYHRLMVAPLSPTAPEQTKPWTETEFASGPPDTVRGDVEVAYNGDLEFREFGPVPRTFFACFIDGRCVRVLGEGDYHDLMEKARRRALLGTASNSKL